MMNIRRLLRSCESFFLSVICDKLRRTKANDAETEEKLAERDRQETLGTGSLQAAKAPSALFMSLHFQTKLSCGVDRDLGFDRRTTVGRKNSLLTEGNLEVQIQINGMP